MKIITVWLSYKVKVVCQVHMCYSQKLVSQLTNMPWLLAGIIVKYMDIISRVLIWHTIGNLIVTVGPCLLGHRVKKGEYM